MKRKIIASAAAVLSLLLAVPLLAQNPGGKRSKTPSSSTTSPTNIGNVSSTGQSLIYKRPSKRRHLRSSPSDIGDISRTRTSLRYRGRKHRSNKRSHHTTQHRSRKSPRR